MAIAIIALLLFFNSDISKYKLWRVNNCVFIGSVLGRDINNEYRINFLTPYSQLVYIDKESQLEVVNVQTEDEINKGIKNKIPCILLSDDRNSFNPKTKRNLIVYFGGNGEDIYHSLSYRMFDKIRFDNTDLLIIGYPGYACSKDKVNAENFYKCSEVISDFINKKIDKNESYKNVAIVGFSIGCSAAINSTTKISSNKVKTLTLINPFQNLKKTAKYLINRKYKIFSPFVNIATDMIDNDLDNTEKIKNITTPMSIIFSHEDEIVNNKDSRILFDHAQKCSTKTLFEVDGRHCDWDIDNVCEIITARLNNREIKFNNIKTVPRIVSETKICQK